MSRKRVLNRAQKRQFLYWNKECPSYKSLLHKMIKSVFRIRIGFTADRHPYPAFLINADAEPDPEF